MKSVYVLSDPQILRVLAQRGIHKTLTVSLSIGLP